MTEIKFEDIRKGDDIDVVWVSGDRMDIIRGTAHHKDDNGWWRTRGSQLLTGPRDGGTITLLHRRPVPAEPEGLGAIVRTAEGIEFVSVNRTPGTRRWVDAMIDDEHGERWALKWDDLVSRHGEIAVVREGM